MSSFKSGPASRSFKLDELAAEAGVPARTVRYYVQRGLLPAPEFRGRDTTYRDEHLLRLLAIKQLQAWYVPLDEIQARLHGASPGELERIARGAEAAAPAYRSAPPPSSPPAPSPHPPAPSRGEEDEVWRRVVLVPGVELFVRDDASPDAHRIAREIQATYRHRI